MLQLVGASPKSGDTVNVRRNGLRLIGSVTAMLLLTTTLVVLGAAREPAEAADMGQFRAGNIISDETFFNRSALNASQIQQFLNSRVTSCRSTNGVSCLKDYSQATASHSATPYCNTYDGQGNESAAQIIQRVALACGINPQVLLVLLEKETGLVSNSAPTALLYRKAMGYGCPDTASCDAAYYGFFNQVYNSASQFQRYTATSSSWGYRPGRYNNIQWHPNAACGSSSVYIENQATANLYIYTPYQPNSAALANAYGTGDTCSSYGNRNFWRIFTDWFGNPAEGNLRSPSFEGGSTNGWGASNGFINQAVVNNPGQAQSGDWFLATNTPTTYRAMSQDVRRNIALGEQATARVWVRSESARPFTGVVAAWGLGGASTEQASTTFTVTDTWQQITVKLPMRQSSHTILRLDIYLLSTDGSLWIDNSSLDFGDSPAVQNLLQHPSFEGSFGGWAPGNGFMNQQIYQDPSIVKHGSWFAASNTPVAGRSFAQLLDATPAAGDRYTFSIWLRSQDPSKRFSGKVALWGLGGSQNIVAVTDFSASGEWQKVSVTLDVSVGDLRNLKAEVYLDSMDNTLFLDDGLLAKNLLNAGSFEGGSFQSWGTGNGVLNYAVYPSAGGNQAAHGGYFAATNTVTAGGSLAQSQRRIIPVGDTYTAEVWVRSADTSKTFSGTLALWALGGTTEVASTPFTANGTWQRVGIELPIRNDDHVSLKYEIYLGTTDNTLFVDAAQVY